METRDQQVWRKDNEGNVLLSAEHAYQVRESARNGGGVATSHVLMQGSVRLIKLTKQFLEFDRWTGNISKAADVNRLECDPWGEDAVVFNIVGALAHVYFKLGGEEDEFTQTIYDDALIRLSYALDHHDDLEEFNDAAFGNPNEEEGYAKVQALFDRALEILRQEIAICQEEGHHPTHPRPQR